MPTVCGAVFDSQEFLCAYDLSASTDMLGLPDAVLEERTVKTMLANAAGAPTPEVSVKLRKRDRWLKGELDAINDRIDRMDQSKELWAVRDRLDDVEGQIQDLRMEVRGLKDDRTSTADPDNPVAKGTSAEIFHTFVFKVTLDKSIAIGSASSGRDTPTNCTDTVTITAGE